MDDTNNSTVLTDDPTPAASGAGVPATLDEPASLRDTIAGVMKEQGEEADKADRAEESAKPEAPAKEEKAKDKPEAKPEKAEEKPEAEEKPVKPRDDTGKFAKPEGEERQDKAKPPEAPQNFLPRAKESWRNVPQDVKVEVHRVLKENDDAIQLARQTNERYESIRPFDELAKSNGRDLSDSLKQMNEIENLMQSNPIAGLNRILMEIGPRKADGQAVSLFELANFLIQSGPQGYQQMVAQKAEQQDSGSEVEMLRERLSAMETQIAARSIIEPFKAEHPRYDELQDDIALFLKSGKIPASLSASDKLAAAYDMAVRVNPSSISDSQADAPAIEARAVSDLGGTKSVKSAPGSVTSDMEPERGGSIRDILQDEMKRRRVA